MTVPSTILTSAPHARGPRERAPLVEAWLRRHLAHEYDDVLDEALPDEFLAIAGEAATTH